MKLKIDLSTLNIAIKKMGAEPITFSTDTIFQRTNIDEILGTTAGQRIDINDIEVNLDGGGLFEYEGRQVLLFIPNQFNTLQDILNDPMQGNRFHVADCKTLQEMKESNRYNKYSVTNNLSGKFTVYYRDNESHTIDTPLHVCKNCLEKLNYKNYKNETYQGRNRIFNTFRIDEFFERYSTLFEYLPNIDTDPSEVNYTDDWEDVSKKYKSSRNYTCETCDASFDKDKRLLHTHHLNGIKDDNSESNLKAVCIDCHRKEPNHKHIMMMYQEMQQIHILRREQGKIIINSWDDVFKFSDLSLHGYLDLLKNDNTVSLPSVGHVVEVEGNKIALDLAWITATKKSALVTEYFYGFFNLKEWNVLVLGEAMQKYFENTINTIEREHNTIQENTKSAIEFQAMIDYTAEIETILESMGARARGLHGKVNRVKKKLSKEVIFRLRRIATIRNKKMHQKGFNNYIFEDFENDCKFVLSELKYL